MVISVVYERCKLNHFLNLAQGLSNKNPYEIPLCLLSSSFLQWAIWAFKKQLNKYDWLSVHLPDSTLKLKEVKAPLWKWYNHLQY